MLSEHPPVAGPSRIGLHYSHPSLSHPAHPFDQQQQQHNLDPIAPSPRTAFSFSFSLKNQFYPGCSPGTLMGPLEMPDLKYTSQLDPENINHSNNNNNSMSLSMTSENFRRMLGSLPKGDGTMCRDYTCCGLNLTDLHALVEHFEEHHVVVVDEPSLNTFIPAPTTTTAATVTSSSSSSSSSTTLTSLPTSNPSPPSSIHATSIPSAPPPTPTTPSMSAPSPDIDIDTMDDMDIDMEDMASSHSSHSSHSGRSTPSPPLTPVLPFDTTSILRPSSNSGTTITQLHSRPTSPRLDLERAFNRYAGYTEFSSMLPGTLDGSSHGAGGFVHLRSGLVGGRGGMGMGGGGLLMSKSSANCLPPSLLSSSSNTPSSTPPPSPLPQKAKPSKGIFPSSSLTSLHSNNQGLSSTTGSSSALLLSKPFQCPTPGCNKSYKQANGLKYHITHGSCNFAPRDESLDALSEKELEERLKPFRCAVGACERRYKNMNGLRYHYQHSGAHGAIGLALLAAGQHEGVHPPHHPSAPSQSHSNSYSHSHQASLKSRSGTSTPSPLVSGTNEGLISA